MLSDGVIRNVRGIRNEFGESSSFRARTGEGRDFLYPNWPLQGGPSADLQELFTFRISVLSI